MCVICCPTGSDSAECTLSDPCATVQRAIAASHAVGGVAPTVHVLAGRGSTAFKYRTLTTSIVNRDMNIVGFRYEYNHTEEVATPTLASPAATPEAQLFNPAPPPGL